MNVRLLHATSVFLALATLAPECAARVRIREGLALDGGPVFVTRQDDVFAGNVPGRPVRLIGRLPEGRSPLVSDGEGAWSVLTGRHAAADVTLWRVSPSVGIASFPVEGPLRQVRIDGVAGSDLRHVFLVPGLRYDRELRVLQEGHLRERPDLEVLATRRRGFETVYLARDLGESEPGVRRLWLLHATGERVDVATDLGPAPARARLEADDASAYVILDAARILRFDRRTLRLAEDLTPMLSEADVGFFATDDTSYWVETGASSEGGGTLRRIEREVLDGEPFVADAVPEGFAPVALDGARVWFAVEERAAEEPLVAVDAASGAAQSHVVKGRGEREWDGFWRGTGNFFVGVGQVAFAVVAIPFWLLSELVGG